MRRFAAEECKRCEDRTEPTLLPLNKLTTRNLQWGTAEELVLKLVVDDREEYRRSFLLSYGIFDELQPEGLMKRLLTLFEVDEIKLKSPRWMTLFFDFFDNGRLLEIFMAFLNPRRDSNDKEIAMLQDCCSVYSKLHSQHVSAKMTWSPPQQEISAPTVQILGSKFIADDVARQLTYLEQRLLRAVRPRELLRQKWTGPRRATATKGIDNYIKWFDAVRGFVVNEILSEQSSKRRVDLMKRAIAIAVKCNGLHNFNTVMEILSALYSPDILKLKAWNNLPAKSFDSFIGLSKLMSSEENYKAYRSEVETLQPPYVPFFGLLLSDLSFLDDFNVTAVDDNLHFNKCRLMSREIGPYLDAIQRKCGIVADYGLQEMIISAAWSSRTSKITWVDDGVVDQLDPSEKRTSELMESFKSSFSHPSALWSKQELKMKTLRPRDWKAIFAKSTSQTFTEKDILFEEGRLWESVPFIVLLKGAVAFRKHGLLTRVLRAHAMVSPMGLLQPNGRTPMCVALTQCECKVIEPSFLISLLETDHHLMQRLFCHMTKEFISMYKDADKEVLDGDQMQRLLAVGSPFHRGSSSDSLKASVSFSSKVHSSGGPSTDVTSQDNKFQNMFGLDKSAIVLKECKAALPSATITVHGALYLSQDHLCFFSRLFNRKTKIVVDYENVQSVSVKKGGRLSIAHISNKRPKTLNLRLSESESVASSELLHSLIQKQKGLSPVQEHHVEQDGEEPSQHIPLSEFRGVSGNMTGHKKISMRDEDWDLVLRGAQLYHLNTNDVIVKEGQQFQRIYQISSGFCRIEKSVNERDTAVLGILGPNEIFGEISFVQGGETTASVIANSAVDLYVIEGYSIFRLMKLQPAIAGRFLQYVATVLAKRLTVRERLEDSHERRVMDIIEAPLHDNLPSIPVKALERGNRSSSSPLICRRGPEATDEEEMQNFVSSASESFAARTISTYPQVPGRSHREGHPICDRYRVDFFKERIVAAVADGCNWGAAPRQAAIDASDAFVEYLGKHHHEIQDMSYAGLLLLRAFSMAQHAVIDGKDADANIGTTTLIGGICLQLLVDSPDSDEPCSSWAFVFASVGDCKAFHYSVGSDKWHDITGNNRSMSRSATDCGGRLGRANAQGTADLRNFELSSYPVDEGDLICLVSDGVHDNLDPEHFGRTPEQCGLSGYETWEHVPLEVMDKTKSRERTAKLSELLAGIAPKELSPQRVVDVLIRHCEVSNEAAAKFMCDFPAKPLPKDYKMYPGKMDHTTCVVLRLGQQPA